METRIAKTIGPVCSCWDRGKASDVLAAARAAASSAKPGSSTNDLPVYHEVRVEYDYAPGENLYRGLAMVRDVSLAGRACNVYLVQSPLVKTRQRALKVAETILGSLATRSPHQATGTGFTLQDLQQHDFVLEIDRDDFSQQLGVLADRWAQSSLNLRW